MYTRQRISNTKRKIIQQTLTKLLITFLIAGGLAYMAVVTYLLIGGFQVFLLQWSAYFLLMYGLLVGVKYISPCPFINL